MTYALVDTAATARILPLIRLERFLSPREHDQPVVIRQIGDHLESVEKTKGVLASRIFF
jgi:hypothetical protein